MSSLGPDSRRALEKYRKLASSYDRRTTYAKGYRQRAARLLALSPGDRVLDVACGTGASFALLERQVGPGGSIVGVDISPDMLARARRRVHDRGWRNVALIEGTVQDADIGGPFDAALFSLTHDVLQTRAAVEKVVASLRPGGRVAAFGPKTAPRWLVPVNALIGLVSARYVTTLENLDRPWRELERLIEDLQVKGVALGAAYLAWGRTASVPGPRASRSSG